jgi:hypothetical protein
MDQDEDFVPTVEDQKVALPLEMRASPSINAIEVFNKYLVLDLTMFDAS